MKEIHSITVPVDFEQHTDQLVEYALYIGKKFDAQLTFLHVVNLPYNWGDTEYSSLALYTAEAEKQTKRRMNELIEEIKKSYSKCEGKTLQGNIAEKIVDHAKKQEADLIIIGTHGRRGVQKLWLGSVAERVIKQAPCPTITCNPYK